MSKNDASWFFSTGSQTDDQYHSQTKADRNDMDDCTRLGSTTKAMTALSAKNSPESNDVRRNSAALGQYLSRRILSCVSHTRKGVERGNSHGAKPDNLARKPFGVARLWSKSNEG